MTRTLYCVTSDDKLPGDPQEFFGDFDLASFNKEEVSELLEYLQTVDAFGVNGDECASQQGVTFTIKEVDYPSLHMDGFSDYERDQVNKLVADLCSKCEGLGTCAFCGALS